MFFLQLIFCDDHQHITNENENDPKGKKSFGGLLEIFLGDLTDGILKFQQIFVCCFKAEST